MDVICQLRIKTVVRIVAVLTVIWFAIAFLYYRDYTKHDSSKWDGISSKLLRSEGDGGGGAAEIGKVDNGILSKDRKVEDGPGEMGKAVEQPASLTAEIKKIIEEGWRKNDFNQYASDMMSLHRSLPDYRAAWCKEPGRYQQNLPVTDVIICFHNEAWSTLLRTVHSVLDRSPEELIGNVVLVDDFSDMPHLKMQLDEYFKAYPKVKIIRLPKREGLIRARLLGTSNSLSPVLTFLDSHCECTEGWLEPLLDRIAKNSKTVACPLIDSINGTTMAYLPQDVTYIGGFDWNLNFKWHVIPEKEQKRRKNSAEPVYSPTMAGGLYSIDRKFFKHLGTYDPGFDIWGGENLELSFKTWMCGGSLEIIPCSHVGHIFRKRLPYTLRPGVNVIKLNSARLAEVWMDDYAKYYYQSIGNIKVDYGDVSERKELRKRLGCKSFKWYLDNIYPEHSKHEELVAYGRIRNIFKSLCLDAPAPSVGIWQCHNDGGNQYFMVSKTGEIRRDAACLDYGGRELTLHRCHGLKGNQFWTYNADSKQIRQGSSDNCLTINEKEGKVIMKKCDSNSPWQKWHLENYDSSK